MEGYYMCNLFALILILKVSMNILYSCIKKLNTTRRLSSIPGVQMMQSFIIAKTAWNTVSTRNMVASNVCFLQAVCGLCKIFEKERIFKICFPLRPLVVFYTPETVEVILNSKLHIDKADEYSFLHPAIGNGLLTSAGDQWRRRRKLLTPSFHFRIFENALPIFNEQSQILVDNLKLLTQNDSVDIFPPVAMCTLNIICETAMGIRINAEANKDNEYVNAVYETFNEIIFRILHPWLWSDIIYFYLCPRGWKFRKNLNIMHNFTRKIIKEKKEQILRQRKENTLQEDADYEQNNGVPKKHRRAFLELLLEHHMNDNTLSEEDIREEVDTFMAGGYESTSTSVIWVLYNIGLRPDVQDKILMELESIFGKDSERPATNDDLKAMKYLDCVLKESMRVYSSPAAIARELTKDLQVLNYRIPQGTLCVILTYVLHRNPEVYSNPEVFDPDRFLPENCVGRHPFAYTPFSAGPRNCIGQKFASLEEKVILSTILRNFMVKSLDERDKVNVTVGPFLKSVDPLRIKLIPHNQ